MNTPNESEVSKGNYFKKKAEELEVFYANCCNCDVLHALCRSPIEHLEEALKEAYEAGVRDSIEVFRQHNGDKVCLCRKLPVEHMPWNELLPAQGQSLLSKPEEK